VVKNFVKCSITGNIKVVDKQEEDEEEIPFKKMKVKSMERNIIKHCPHLVTKTELN
jgi:hypothetical protein